MNGGQVCRTIEESAWEDGPPPIPDLATPVPESGARQRRSSIETMPASDPFSALQEARPDWCVDAGDVLLTMTTFELWSAIERRDVPPWMRVWREGLECWTPVRDLPELRWAVSNLPRALADTELALEAELPLVPEPTPADAISEPITPQAITPAPEPSAPVVKVTASDAPARAVSRQISRGSLPDQLPEVTPAPTTSAPIARPREAQRGARWVFAGSAVASLAIAAAIFHVAVPAAGPALDAPRAAAWSGEAAPANATRTTPSNALPANAFPATRPAGVAPAPRPIEPAPIETSPEAETSLDDPSAPASPPTVRREERGQRRLSRSGRRAHGR
ncbi:MAG: hypothetical protein QM820_49285 [Minicystis sp.]